MKIKRSGYSYGVDVDGDEIRITQNFYVDEEESSVVVIGSTQVVQFVRDISDTYNKINPTPTQD